MFTYIYNCLPDPKLRSIEHSFHMVSEGINIPLSVVFWFLIRMNLLICISFYWIICVVVVLRVFFRVFSVLTSPVTSMTWSVVCDAGVACFSPESEASEEEGHPHIVTCVHVYLKYD